VTLKTKLVLAQAPLAVALAVVGSISGAVTARLGDDSSRILADNYRSVLAAQRMKDAIDRGDRRLFERELAVQESNITEAGERDATARLRRHWQEYQSRGGNQDGAAARVRGDADEILALNQDAMVRKSERVQRRAEQFQALLIAAVTAAALLGLLASIALITRLLRPVGVVGAAVRRFGQGDLKARARVSSRDEIAQLAVEFNTMADKLERYRQSSLGELIQAQQAAQAAIDGLPDPIVLLEAGGKLLGVNVAASGVLKIDPEKHVADPLAGVDPGVRAVLDRFRAHTVGGKGAYVPRGFEEAIRLAAPEGERIFLPRAAPIYGETGEVAGVAVVFQDITRVFRFDELKNNLVATVAHEFRTPLTSLRMAIHLCLEQAVGPLTVKQDDLLHAARDDCERLQGIVDDLLNLSRIESGRIDLHKRRITPDSLIEQAIDVHRTTAEDHNVTVRSEVPPGSPEVFADPDRLQLVFTNLLSNAIRYSPTGGEIVVSVKPELTGESVKTAHRLESPGWIRFEVRDQGPGIPLQHQAGLFEKFFRVPGSPEGGSGLGLFIARGIVQAHGGQVGLESKPGAGATFWFTVRAAPEIGAVDA
jgi:two-component system, NtrC family, sensor histidine kinase KinB